MAKAKNKETAVTVIEFTQRAKNFEAALIELIKTHQVGLKPELSADRTKIQAVLSYVDLVELAKQDAAAREAKVATEKSSE